MSRPLVKTLRILTAGLFAALAAVIAAKELPGISNMDRGVSIQATPVDVAPGAATWTFDVRLNTHSGDLADDLVRESTLVADGSKQYRPIAWDGSPPGGHHRAGVLKFAPIRPAPAAIELRIQRAGEAAPRTFKWQLQ